MVLSSEEAAKIRGPATVDCIGPAQDWEAHWQETDAQRRRLSSWAARPVLRHASSSSTYGLKAAFEIIATAGKRQHEPQRIIDDLLTALITEKQAHVRRTIGARIAAA
jgi:hypothetical protein